MLRNYFSKVDRSVYFCAGVLICYGILWWMNAEVFQAFCQPVQWAKWVLMFSAGSFAFHFLKLPVWLTPFLWFFNGVFMWVCLYAVFFMYNSEFFLLGLIFTTVLVMGPLLPIVLLIIKYVKLDSMVLRRSLRWGMLMPFFILISGGVFYAMAYVKIADRKMEQGYWEERIEGMHFKYHTRLCLYDGWRPPLHDPLLVLYNAIIGDPLQGSDLHMRIRFYHSQFPDLPVREPCTCSNIYDSKEYLYDPVFLIK